ncbi:MAG: hypothetical protein LBJ16_02590, partial [Holosporaceae bacterium]|nr:hypothetical protein [Holosporaceae bacterium]
MKAKDFVPIILASTIAIVITAVVKWLIPSSESARRDVSDEVSMPDIPLMAKDKTKKRSIEIYVLMVGKEIKKDEKITEESCSWKRWMEDAM